MVGTLERQLFQPGKTTFTSNGVFSTFFFVYAFAMNGSAKIQTDDGNGKDS